MNELLTPDRPALSHRLRMIFGRSEWGLLAAIAVVLLLTALLDTQHNYWHKPRPSAVNILRETAFLGIFALGAAIVIIAGGIDLSSGSVIAFSGSVCAMLMALLAPEALKNSLTIPPWVIGVSIAGTLIVGLLIGSFHAWLITVIRLPPFVATLASLVGLRSLARLLMGQVTKAVWESPKSQIDIAAVNFRALTVNVWIPITIFAVLAALSWVLMSRTVVGRHLHALGGNEQAARLSGIATDRLKWLAYCLSAVLASVAGILYVSDTTTANPLDLGRGYELNGIAAAVVGGCSLTGGVGTIPGTVLGVLFLRVVIDGIDKIVKLESEKYSGLIVGIVVVVAVALTQLRQARRGALRFFPGALGWVTILNLAILAGVVAVVMNPSETVSPLKLGLIVGIVTLGLLIVVRVLEHRRSAGPKIP